MKERDFFKKWKQHPESFDLKNDSGFDIDEKDIPPISQWFYVIKKKEQQRQRKKWKFRALVAIPACVVIVMILMATPFGKTFADSLFHVVSTWSDDSSSVSLYYGPQSAPDSPQENSLPDSENFDSTDAVRKEYGIVLAENRKYNPETITLTKDEDAGYFIDISYKINSSHVVIYNTFSFDLVEEGSVTSATSENYKPIDTSMQNNVPVAGIYDDDGAIASGYFDRLCVTFSTNDLPYDQLIDFIQSTTIK